MAKKSSVNRNKKRIALNLKFANKRRKLKEIIMNKKVSLEERFKAQMKLTKLPLLQAVWAGMLVAMVCNADYSK